MHKKRTVPCVCVPGGGLGLVAFETGGIWGFKVGEVRRRILGVKGGN